MGIKAFELVYPNCNRLVLVNDYDNIKHVTYKKKSLITAEKIKIKSKSSTFWQGVDIVVLHSMFIYDITIPSGIKVIWLGFGYDYYDLIFTSKADYFNHKTKRLLKVEGGKEKAKTVIKSLSLKNRIKQKQRVKLIERVDIFCPVLTKEYQLIKWPTKHIPKLMDWNYGTMEDDWAKAADIKLTGENILLGNSATHTCNHLDGIDLVTNTTSFNGKLVLPLSYGDKEYGQTVKEYAQKNYPGEVIALENFMSFDSYMKLISSCSFVIMPHKRQQGLGNIIMLMNLGAKIFLDKDNLLYDYLKENGFYIFALEDVSSPNFQAKLTATQVAKNKKLLHEIWGKHSILSKTKALVECELKAKESSLK